MTALAIPVIPSLPSGHVVSSSDLSALCSAASFLIQRPMTLVVDQTAGMAIGTAGTLVSFTNDLYDVDGAWSNANAGRVTIQTPGWYKVRYAVNCLPAGNAQAPFVTYMTATNGPNNPAGAGTSSNYWAGYADGSSGVHSFPGAAGLWPFYLYSGDYLQLYVYAQAAGASTSAADPVSGAQAGSFLAIEYVSTL